MAHSWGGATIIFSLHKVSGISTVCVDVSNLELVKKELERCKPIHLLVNNAAIGHLRKFLEVSVEEYDRSGDSHMTGTVCVHVQFCVSCMSRSCDSHMAGTACTCAILLIGHVTVT